MGSVLFLAFLAAAMTPDVVDAAYYLVSFCSPYGLYSHTIYAVAIESAVVGGAALLITGSRAVALGFALVVLAHFPADFFTGHKLLLPGGELHGLDLYRRPLVDITLEVGTILAGWWMLRRSGTAPRWAGSVWVVVVLVCLQVAFGLQTKLSKPSGCVAVGPMEQRAALVVQR